MGDAADDAERRAWDEHDNWMPDDDQLPDDDDVEEAKVSDIKKLFCSECGGSDLSAWYPQTERQTIAVWRKEDGSITMDYTGGTESIGDAGDDENYQCHGCGRLVETLKELVGDPIPPTPLKWTFVWETTEGPSLGPICDSEEQATDAAFKEWDGYQGGTIGGWDEGTRAEFDAIYRESGDLWIVPLQPKGE